MKHHINSLILNISLYELLKNLLIYFLKFCILQMFVCDQIKSFDIIFFKYYFISYIIFQVDIFICTTKIKHKMLQPINYYLFCFIKK